MSEQTINSFTKGMIKDVADTLRPEDSYEDAYDINIRGLEGSTDYIVSNIKGNELMFTIPDVPQIAKVTTRGGDFPDSWNFFPTIIVNGTNVAANISISQSSGGTIDDFFDQFENSLKTDPAFTPYNLIVKRIGSTIRAWSESYNIAFTILFSSYPNVITETQSAQTTQQIIGWVTVGDKIYLYSANTGSGSIGTIWKLTYDEVTLVPTITLMYSEDLNMGTLNPIANPGGIESILENSQTERLYWTDRVNPLRTINIVDENAMCFAPEDLDLRLTSNLEKPTLLSVQNGGALVTGVYQIAYNLRNLDGAITAYSHTSNVIDIIDSAYTGYANISGNDSGELTSKSFTISIENVDTTYTFLDLVVLRKETDSGVVVINKINDIPINDTDFQYTVTGNEPASNITELAFNRIAIFFEKCHAIAQKDNILFAANTEERTFDVDFDARAYRFDRSQNTLLADIQGNQQFYTAADLLSQQFYIPETEDAINPLPTTSFRWQTDGSTLGGEGVNIKYKFIDRGLSSDARDDFQSRKEWSYTWNVPWEAASGTNQYLNDGLTYGTQHTYANYKSPTSRHQFAGYRRGETYRFAWVPVKDGVEGFAKWIADIKMPEIFEAGPNKEYNEDYNYLPHTYETPTKWQVQALGVEFDVTIPQNVADQIDSFRIKRVKLEERDRTILGQGILHMSLQYFDNPDNGTPGTYHPIASVVPDAQQWGLNAGINNWQGTPSGYYNSYVSTAPINFTFPNGDETPYFTQSIYSFHSPDFLFGNSPGTEDGDYIKIVGGLTEWANTFDKDLGGGGASTNGYKLYEYAPVNWHLSSEPETVMSWTSTGGDPVVQKPVLNGTLVGLGNSVSVGSKTYYNNSAPMANYNNGGDSFTGCGSLGTDTFLVDLGGANEGRIPSIITDSTAGSGIPFSNNTTRDPNGTQLFYPYDDGTAIGRGLNVGDKIVANYIRPRKAQYGGAGYAARSKNVYINTGCNIVMNGQTTFNNIKVFGGDTFVNIFDTYKMLRNFQQIAPEDWYGTALYYPVESNVNTDLREGIHLSGEIGGLGYIYNGSDPLPDADKFPLDYGEDYKYNYMFSLTMDTQKSFPKPVGFEEITEHPHRIWASNAKTHGERVDAWRQFDNEKYIDIQGDLGEIRQLINRNGTLMAWQKYGFGIPSVNERSILNDQSGSGIVLGKSGVLPRFDYISQTVGSWHQFSFAVSPNGVMFFDSKDGAIYIYAQQGIMNITESKINNWLYANTRDDLLSYDAPYVSLLTNIGGITSTYDYVNKEFLITIYNSKTDEGSSVLTIIDNSYTLAYSEPLNTFVSYRSYKPIMYINDKRHIISPKPQLTVPITSSKMYIHEEGDRGVFYDNEPSESSITITVNKEPYATKIFDNIRWFTEVFNPNGTEASDETFSEAEIYNTYQTTGVRTVFKRLMREWKHAITYAQNSKNRIRSHYVKQKFKFLNNNNKEFRLHYIMNLFRRILK